MTRARCWSFVVHPLGRFYAEVPIAAAAIVDRVLSSARPHLDFPIAQAVTKIGPALAAGNDFSN